MTNKIIILVALLFANSVLSGQTTISIGKVTSSGVMPREVLVPVGAAAQISNIKSITMQFSYNPDVLTFDYNSSQIRSGIKNFAVSDTNLAVSCREGIISISWVTNITGGVTLPSGKLFDLDFTFVTGFSEVRFLSAVIKNIQGKRQSLTLGHGSVSTDTNPAVTLTYPNGGETIEVLSGPANITWTSVYISNVSIEYSTDNGTSWNIITDNYAAINDSYLWTVPDTLNSVQCKIKISDTASTTISDESDDVFTINSTPVLTLTTPNGGEELKVNGVKFIRWKFKNIYNVKLEYSTNASAGTPVWNTIAESIPAADTTYDWIIPNTISGDCKIKISNVADPSTSFDLSDAVFVIHNNPVTVKIDDVVDAKVKIIGKVLDPLYVWWKPGYSSWQLAPAHNEYDWNDDDEIDFEYDASDTLVLVGTVPVRTGWLTSVRYFELSLSYDPNVLAVDSITSTYKELNKINYSYENGIMHFIWGTTQPIDLHGKIFDIVYKYVNMDKPVEWFKIEDWGLFGASAVSSINTPTAIIDHRNFSKLKIQSFSAKNSINDYIDASSWTNGSLSISNMPAVRILSPKADDTLEVSDVTHNIRWSSKLVNNADLSYSTDGSGWILINTVPAANGSYTWTLPNINSGSCYLRIGDSGNILVADTAKVFRITNVKSIDLKSPDGGEILKTGTKKKIFWLSRNISTIRLDYSTDAGLTWKPITEGVPAKDYEYEWTIPEENSTNVNLRIRDMADSLISDLSTNVFTINNTKTKMTISSVMSGPGNVTVPVNSDKVNGATFFKLCIIYDTAVMKLSSVTKASAINAGQLSYNDNLGTVYIVWYSTTPVDFSGNLFSMSFINYTGAVSVIQFDSSSQVRDDFNQYMDIEFVNGGVGVTEVEKNEIPAEFSLSQNYPNPFNPVTTINYEIPSETHVSVMISNILGERVALLVDEIKKPGFYNVLWKADNYASGIYYYTIVTKEFIRTKKMILLK